MSQSGPGSNCNEVLTPHSQELQIWSISIRCRLVITGHSFGDKPPSRPCSAGDSVSAFYSVFSLYFSKRDALSITVVVVRNGISDLSSNPG